MTLLAIALAGVFVAGVILGAFLLVVVSIHVEERRRLCKNQSDSRTGAVTRRLLGVHGRKDNSLLRSQMRG